MIQSLFSLTNRVAIITGGSRGLGAQMATAYAEAGANIAICSRDGSACEEMAQRLTQQYGIQAYGAQCDVTDEEQITQFVTEVMRQFGKIDILINNSGASWATPAEDMPLSAWQKVMDVNVTGTFLMSKAVGQHMIQAKQGKIINIASIAGFGGTPAFMQTVGYNTSKGAIITFTKDLAVKWGQYNICVNALAPGFFPTKMSQVLIKHGQEYIMQVTPLGKLGSDEDLKGAAIFLASSAADYITGVILPVDGGASAL
ncbi:gluconate 5-dehydrogenase [Lysinibacillus alkalisoli]|uniref:Gluconate 5-dehydrogenase n=1 Tax=Lysinibacillus alkalisoli TaxID=1911548 RepID=A0A917LIT7_9BACI|nr:SDR family oxidoreductase [Lysinibacillus alkalisoli]GGG28018.1 gluconate 5-dehydrogenase [Lysinibacillus alkalisoli]